MHRPSAALLLSVSLLALSACARKAPIAPPADRSSAASTVDVASPPAPRPEPHAGPHDPFATSDLDLLNETLRREGLLGDVFFGFDRYDLDDVARQRLESNARFLVENPDLIVRIEGHCDERGTNEYNLALGSRRADVAAEIVRTLGVDGGRLEPISMGEENPSCRDSAETCWSKNRRARFVVVGRRS